MMDNTPPRHMRLSICRVLLLLLVLWTHASSAASETLQVALYPYVPDAHDLFLQLKTTFEAAHPGVTVALVDSHRDERDPHQPPIPLAADYYTGGLVHVEADIYEIDTVLLVEMINAKKIAPVALPDSPFLPEAQAAVQFAGHTWGAPHWVCGNFLFYEQGDEAIAQARTWQEPITALPPGSILGDFTGSATLGEWYLTSLASHNGDPQAVLAQLQTPTLSASAVAALESLLRLCLADACRSAALHAQPGSYARLFVHKQARAYIGYSETLHEAMQELREHCGPNDGCRTADQISVRALPALAPQGRAVGWVDALAIAAHVQGSKRQLAEAFLTFATLGATYERLLNPTGPVAPRYLLPPYRLDGSQVSLTPPLYPTLFAAFGSRFILPAAEVNTLLQARGHALDCRLPSARGERGRPASCSSR